MLGENALKEQEDKESQDMLEESLSDSEVSGSFDSEQLTPKQSLLNGLIRLGDPKTKKYSLTEREHFVFDLENVLKVLTFKETVAYIFPVLDVYAAEQEYLKIELFRQIPNVFKKLMKSPARPSDQDSLDLLTVNIFPLISQILMTSEDQVQTEGVKALHQISVDYLPRDEATFLVFNVVQLLIKKSDQIENAKIAVLMLIEKFAEADFFEKKECMSFLENSMDTFLDGALFKIKKQILPCILALAKHVDYTTFQHKIFSTYQKFARDSIWGVRRVAIEFMPDVIKKLKPNETDRICKCLDALKLGISDESKWVKNQAFQNFGKIIYEVHLHTKEPIAKKKDLMAKIAEVCDDFLDPSRIAGKKLEEESVDLDDPVKTAKLMLSSGTQDEMDRVKEMWAFNLPCILLVNGGKQYWKTRVRDVYKILYKDILLNVRKSLAASLIEVAKLIDLKEEAPDSEDHLFMVEVANHLLSDVDEVRVKLLPHLCEFVSLFPSEN